MERLYEVFAKVPKPARIDGCPCCMESKRVDVLLRRPLGQ
jgi:hypothetical protein